MPNPIHLETLFEEVERKRKALPKPTGTRDEIAAELLRRCAARDEELGRLAIECEREGDEDFTWLCMAARAETRRLRDRIYRDMPHLKPAS